VPLFSRETKKKIKENETKKNRLAQHKDGKGFGRERDYRVVGEKKNWRKYLVN
jgi:hypothetical protein